MKRNLILLGGLLIAVAVGIICSGYFISGREFSSVEQHMPAAGDENGTPVARSYAELKNQIIRLVETAQNQGTILLKDYTADVENDLARACHEVMTETPIGAYAVDMMSIDHTRVLGYYDVKVNVSYKRPQEEVLGIRTVSGADELKDVIKDAALERRQAFAILCNYYSEQLIDVEDTMHELKISEPDATYGVGDATVQLFPLSGLHRILLVELEFYESAEESELKRSQATQAVRKIAEDTAHLSDGARVRDICRRIRRGVDVVAASRDADTPYAALVEKRASDRALAAAVQQVMNLLGIYSVVVEGSLNGEPHFWNMVFAEKTWEHIDLSRGLVLIPKDKMSGYAWDDMKYPANITHLRNQKAS